MKTALIGLVVVFGTVIPSAHADTVLFDLTGVNSWDQIFSPNNEHVAIDIGGNYLVTGFAWNVTLQTFHGSAYTDVLATMEDNVAPFGIPFALSGVLGDHANGNFATDGILPLASISYLAGNDGMVNLEIREANVHAPGQIEATFLSGSWIVVQYSVPEPGAIGVVMAGGLLAACRRRAGRAQGARVPREFPAIDRGLSGFR